MKRALDERNDLYCFLYEEDITGAHWKSPLTYLDEAYRTLLEGKTADDLEEEYDAYWIGEAEIFE